MRYDWIPRIPVKHWNDSSFVHFTLIHTFYFNCTVSEIFILICFIDGFYFVVSMMFPAVFSETHIFDHVLCPQIHR